MSKKPSPPPRPPAPKVGGGGGISFSFKALEEEDDDELTTLTGKFDKKVHDDKEQQERERSHSKSPESRSILHENREKSPSIVSQKSMEKFIDFKGKIQDSINKKIEEFSESQKSSKSNSCPAICELDTAVAAEEHLHESHSDVETEYHDISNENHVNGEELDINEEFFSPEGEEFSELPGFQPSLRQRTRVQKHKRITPIVQHPPVQMSTLNTSNQGKVENHDEGIVIQSKNNKANKCLELPNSDRNNVSTITIQGTKVPVRVLVGCAIGLFLYLVLPLPSYIKGMMAGAVLSSGGWLLYIWVTTPPPPREPIPVDPPLEELPPLIIPEIKEPKGEDGVYKGWMNEVMDYSLETYSINQTHSVHVLLEGTSLRLRRPKVNVPKRAMWDEPNQPSQFIHQRHFELEGSKVLLLPNGLVKKRLWSKKYPICVILAKDGKKQEMKTQSSRLISVSHSTGKLSTSSSVDSVNGFEVVSEQKCENSILHLFARTCPEKEQWFRRLDAASKGTPLKNHILEVRRILSNTSSHRRSSSTDSLMKTKRQESSDSLSSLGNNSPLVEEKSLPGSDFRNYVLFMSRLMPRDRDTSVPSSPAHQQNQKGDKADSKAGSEGKAAMTSVPRGIVCESSLLALNALLGRCFWDFLKDGSWASKVQDKLQKKLSKIHIPYFLEEIRISDISLGSEVPVIRRTNRPYLDEQGFWVDMDVTYSGKFKMTIETKVNLLKLKQQSKEVKVVTKETTKDRKSAVTDEEEEDSAESSSDEEEGEAEEEGNSQTGGAGKKLMKYINKITASKYFQSAAENKYIKKAMTEVSNTPLVLTVEMQKLTGTLALNIPPPPTDRLWYGFRGNPQLWLVAKPKVGEREVTMSHITEWIEKKLALEFQHVLVMPNMDDLIIPILLPGNEMDLHYCDESEV